MDSVVGIDYLADVTVASTGAALKVPVETIGVAAGIARVSVSIITAAAGIIKVATRITEEFTIVGIATEHVAIIEEGQTIAISATASIAGAGIPRTIGLEPALAPVEAGSP